MDIFQGWYKDGTEGTYDYRPLSSLYMILRLVLAFAFFQVLVSREFVVFQVANGVIHTFLGIAFLTVKPYKIKWMSHTDGCILLLLGFILLTWTLENRIIYLVGFVFGLSVTLFISLYMGYKCLKKVLNYRDVS